MKHMLIAILLSQASDAEMARIDEWAKGQPENGPGRIGVGDEYFKAVKKFPKERARFMDKANEWWAKGWPDLDPIWKDKTRESLRRIYAGQPAPAKGLRDWGVGQFVKADCASTCVRSGLYSMRLLPQKTNIGLAEAATTRFAVKGVKEISASLWSLSDGTDGGETAVIHVYDGRGKEVATALFNIPSDTPVWIKCEAKVTLPDDAATATFIYLSSSKKGTVYVDDLSIKGDAKELLPNGSFDR